MSRIKPFSPLFGICALLIAAWAFADGAAPAPASHAASTSKVQSVAPRSGAAKHHAMPRVDLNAASKEDLMKLPGMTEEVAGKIVAARPFKAKGELLSKGIVSKTEYAKLAPRVIAKSEAAK